MTARAHPRLVGSLRWRVLELRAWQLLAIFLLAEVLAGFVITALIFAARGPHSSVTVTFGSGIAGFFRADLATTAALLGQGSLPGDPHNATHDGLALLAAIFATLTPAVVLGVVLLRLFAIRIFHFRGQISLITDGELDTFERPSGDFGPGQGLLSVRFYKRLRGVTVHDLSAKAYLRFVERSQIDGTNYIRRRFVKVTTLNGEVADSRTWPSVGTCMPLTLYLPAELDPDGRVASVGGEHIPDGDVTLTIRVMGTIGGLGSDIIEEHRYSLTDDLQLGRPAPVEPDPKRDVQAWFGWESFDSAAIYGVFAYGSLMRLDTIRDLLGKEPVRGVDYVRVTVINWRRNWKVCTDNTTSTHVWYTDATGQRPPVTVHFLNLAQVPDERTDGLLVRVTAQQLALLDKREGNYLRHVVSPDVLPHNALGVNVVWAYCAKQDRADRAVASIAEGTAVIRKDYLDIVQAAAREALGRPITDDTPLPPGMRVQELTRHQV